MDFHAISCCRPWRAVAPILLVLASNVCLSGEGVDASTVRFAQTADLSGSRAALTKELNAGTVAYFTAVNEHGGVNGRKLVLQTDDDGYEVARTREIVARHLQDDDVFAFVSTIGTANAVAVLPLIEQAKVPLIAPLSGAAQLREPFRREVFHVRASYAQEVDKMIEHVVTLGITRVAVFYDDDAFGADVLQAVQASLSQRKMAPAATGKISRGSDDVEQAVRTIAAAQPQVVICGSFGRSLVEFVNRMQLTGARPTYYALSFFTAGNSIAQLGANARGIGVTQVMPNPLDVGVPLVREYQEVMRRHAPDARLTPISLEGFVTARVLVEALRRAGPHLTRARFVEALESLHDYDMGSLHLSFTPTRHSGLRYVDISVVSDRERVLR
jgi:ABC-type branched-subunit amino acid transport system substrate-binding protein